MKVSQILSQDQPQLRMIKDAEFRLFGDSDSDHDGTLSYCDTLQYWKRAVDNPHVSAIITTEALCADVILGKGILIAPVPRTTFYKFYLSHLKSLPPTQDAPRIGRNCRIDSTARIAPGTTIGDDVVIEPGATIQAGTTLDRGVRIHSGAVVGADGLLYFTENGQNVFLPHSGGTHIAEHAVIMANAVIARGVFSQNLTRVGPRAIVGIASTVGHEASVGADVVIAGNCVIARGAQLRDRCLVNTASVIREYISVGVEAKVRAGSVVIQDVSDREEVSGNFAMRHSVHLKNYLRATL